ncbi:MAG: hypothetical protein N3H31_04320 [Candidatus Nezhaarchaeota archaeon]|nr:hypothetical protein [Candidatus Nezhaarchaeota archaeon]
MHSASWVRHDLLASRVLEKLALRVPGLRGHEPEGRILTNIAVGDFRSYIKHRPLSSGVSYEDYVDFWAERWLDKWRERVKLVFGQQDLEVFAKHEKIVRETAPLWRGFSHLPEALELIIDALIDVGELCFTKLLAEATLRSELLRIKQSSRSIEEALSRVKEGALSIVKSAVARARGYRYVKGHLVWLRVGEDVWRTSYGKIVETPAGDEETYGAVNL